MEEERLETKRQAVIQACLDADREQAIRKGKVQANYLSQRNPTARSRGLKSPDGEEKERLEKEKYAARVATIIRQANRERRKEARRGGGGSRAAVTRSPRSGGAAGTMSGGDKKKKTKNTKKREKSSPTLDQGTPRGRAVLRLGNSKEGNTGAGGSRKVRSARKDLWTEGIEGDEYGTNLPKDMLRSLPSREDKKDQGSEGSGGVIAAKTVAADGEFSPGRDGRTVGNRGKMPHGSPRRKRRAGRARRGGQGLQRETTASLNRRRRDSSSTSSHSKKVSVPSSTPRSGNSREFLEKVSPSQPPRVRNELQ